MPLHEIELSKLREYCKDKVENLEIWLRRIIDEEFTSKYGSDYFTFTDNAGKRIIKGDVVRKATERMNKEPDRYNRLIDAVLLDDAISIICNRSNKQLFMQYFAEEYSGNLDFARHTMMKLVPIRNKLSHSHAISVREAEKIVCYTSDLIHSFKVYYKEKNMQERYNAPTFIRLKDSFGNTFESTQIRRNGTGRGLCDTRRNSTDVYSLDTLSIEVEVDPSFDINTYTIDWVVPQPNQSVFEVSANKLVLKLEDRHVKEDFTIYVLVTSNNEWHRCGDCDDAISIVYRVLPAN